MKEKLYIPEMLQVLIDDIGATELNLGEVLIDNHPMISVPHERYLRICKMIPNLEILRTDIFYKQILKGNDGLDIPSNLPSPDWTILSDETSTLRNANNERIEVPVMVTKMIPVVIDEGLPTEHTEEIIELDEDGKEIWIPKLSVEGQPVRSTILLNSHKYLLWLLKGNKAGLIDLLSGYMQEKLLLEPDFKLKLDQLI